MCVLICRWRSLLHYHYQATMSQVKLVHTQILHPCLHPLRDLFVLAQLDTKFRSYVCLLHLPVNNSEQCNVFNCFLTVMPVCLLKKTARQQRTIIEPYPSPASSDALLGFVFGVLSSSWVRNLCSMCVCV